MSETTPDGAQTDYSYGQDAHGSTSMPIGEGGAKDGQAQASYGYTPYGEPDKDLTSEKDPQDATGQAETKADDPLNNYRYSAKRLDPASGQLDMGARRYSPDTTRFVQEDLYEDALGNMDLGTDPLTQNRYSLAGGNPVSFIEVDGHEPVSSYQRDRRGRKDPYYGRKAAPKPKAQASSGARFAREAGPALKNAASGARDTATDVSRNSGLTGTAPERAQSRGRARVRGDALKGAVNDPVGTAKSAVRSLQGTKKRSGEAGLAGRLAVEVGGLGVVPDHVVHPGHLGGWGCQSHPSPRRTPDEAAP